MSASKPQVLLITMGPVGAEMAGAAIRSYELARALRPHADVTVAAPGAAGASVLDVPVVYYTLRDPRELRDPVAAADAIVAQPQWPLTAHLMRRSGARLIFDLYDPEPFEIVQALERRSPSLRSFVTLLTLDRIIDALFSGHHFICASGKQRDLWIGMMVALRLLGPRTYDRDASLDSIIGEVPFGLPSEPPVLASGGPRLRDRFAILPEDEVVLWNGGIWSWLDAPTAIRAMALLRARRPRAKLVFMGASEARQAREAEAEARRIAGELGLLDSGVFFNDVWVPYADRAGWLLDADCAVSTQVQHLETRFAFRTRLLDCFWTGLPVVCTRGDELAQRIERDGLGAAVPERDPEALAAALEAVLERGRGAYAEAIAGAAADYAWARMVEPLLSFIAQEPPPRLGAGVRRPALVLARSRAFRAAFGVMNTLGIKPWLRP
jgi:glycosyltransferase involved in cell wall biosynthesis